jgi:hypothetical protein
MTRAKTKKQLRDRRAALLELADDLLGVAMRISNLCPLTADKIKEAQFIIDDALTLSTKDR